jgi:hypothetical protein
MPNAASRFNLPAPLKAWQLGLLLAIYLVVGTTGHLPWRGDDLTYLGPIHAILTHGNWLIPELAGETFRDFPPLYYWVGALLAKALGWLLPIHDAARLASSLFTAAFLYWIGVAARRLYGPTAFAPAILLGVSSSGWSSMPTNAHETQPVLAQLAGMALCYAGLGELSEHPWRAASRPDWAQASPFSRAACRASLHDPGDRPPLCCAPAAVAARLSGHRPGAWPHRTHQRPWLAVAHHARRSLALVAGGVASVLPHASHVSELENCCSSSAGLPGPVAHRRMGGLAQPPGHRQPPACAPADGQRAGDPAGRHNRWSAHGGAAARAPSPLPAGRLRREQPASRAANAFDWFGVMTFTFFGILVWLGWSALHFGWPPGLPARSPAWPPISSTVRGLLVPDWPDP